MESSDVQSDYLYNVVLDIGYAKIDAKVEEIVHDPKGQKVDV